MVEKALKCKNVGMLVWVLVWGRRAYIVRYVHIGSVVEAQVPLPIHIQDTHIPDTTPRHTPYPVHAP